MDKKKARYRAAASAAAFVLLGCVTAVSAGVDLKPASDKAGYIARLLINEAPFPGERGYVSEEDTKATMVAVLWVLNSRIKHIPSGYTQEEIASIRTDNIIDVITAGGTKRQCDGFYKDAKGRPVTVARVEQRIKHLVGIANQGTPGKFGRLLTYGQGLASAYVRGGIEEADRFAGLSRVGSVPVTGRAYSWMTDRDYYNPGGNFIKIPDANDGVLGGNRFFTLREL